MAVVVDEGSGSVSYETGCVVVLEQGRVVLLLLLGLWVVRSGKGKTLCLFGILFP